MKSIRNAAIIILITLTSAIKAQTLSDEILNLFKTGLIIGFDAKSNNTITKLFGSWTKYQVLYPNGKKEMVAYDQRITFSFYPEYSNNNLLGYTLTYTNGSSIKGSLWFGTGGTLCFDGNYEPYKSGLEWKFGIDNRGIECLMIKAVTLTTEPVWIIYRKQL